jgi:type IV pilus assembly protein PilQ
MRKNGNIVLIAPREELALKEKQQLESQSQINDLEPLRTESFQLNYAKATDILNIIKGTGGTAAGAAPPAQFLSKRGTAFVDPRTNILFVTDIASRLEEVRRVIRQIDTSVRQVLIEARIVIADFTGLNIVTSDTVTGSLTLRLKDVPWDQALDIILQTKGLDMRKNGNIVLIAPREELALKEKQQLESQAQINDLEPLQTEMFQLNYAKAQDILGIVSVGKGADQGARFLSRRGTAFVDPRTNILFVTDIASRLEEVRRVIRQIDTSVRQVLIEARIVIADDTFSRQLGIRFGQQTGATLFGRRYAFGSGGSLATQPVVSTTTGGSGTVTRETRTQSPFELASGIASAGYSDSPQLNVNLPVANPAGQLALTLINLGSGNLINLELTALEADNRGKVVSSPRVITGDNQKAHIEQGTEIPYVTPGSANSPATVSFKKAVLALDVTPQITPDGRVIMQVEIRKDSVGQLVNVQGGGQVPAIDTKNVLTQIAVNNGDTAVIGGIYEEVIRNDKTQVPFLGDVPVLGNLFKTTSRSSQKTELLIFLTPRIVRDTVTSIR